MAVSQYVILPILCVLVFSNVSKEAEKKLQSMSIDDFQSTLRASGEMLSGPAAMTILRSLQSLFLVFLGLSLSMFGILASRISGCCAAGAVCKLLKVIGWLDFQRGGRRKHLPCTYLFICGHFGSPGHFYYILCYKTVSTQL